MNKANLRLAHLPKLLDDFSQNTAPDDVAGMIAVKIDLHCTRPYHVDSRGRAMKLLCVTVQSPMCFQLSQRRSLSGSTWRLCSTRTASAIFSHAHRHLPMTKGGMRARSPAEIFGRRDDGDSLKGIKNEQISISRNNETGRPIHCNLEHTIIFGITTDSHLINHRH